MGKQRSLWCTFCIQVLQKGYWHQRRDFQRVFLWNLSYNLHMVKNEWDSSKSHLVTGHEIVGIVTKVGEWV